MISHYGYVIEGVPVSGKNSSQIAWNKRTGKPFVRKSNAAAGWQMEAIAQLVEQRLEYRFPTLDGPLKVEYVVYQPVDRCDIDNMEAALFDALKKALVIRDDKLIQDHRGRKAVDKARPRFEVFVYLLQPVET